MLLALCCVLVVMAGCSGLPGSDSDTNASDGENSISIADHEEALRAADSFTYNRTVKVTDHEMNFTNIQYDFARVEVSNESLVYKHVPLGGSETKGYVAPNGSVYAKEGSRYTDEPFQKQTDDDAIDPGLFTYLSWFDLSRDGTTTIDGHEVVVYRSEGREAMDDVPLEAARENVTAVEAHAYVTEAGWINEIGMNLTIDSTEQSITYTEILEYSDVGATSVDAPDWLSTAKQEIAKPGPQDVVTRDYSGQTDNATMTITARKYHQGDDAMVELQSEDPAYDRERAVSEYIDVYYTSDAEQVNLTIEYDDSRISDENESKLAMYWREDVFTFNRMESTLDTEANTVTASLNTDGKYYSYVVMLPPEMFLPSEQESNE